MKYLFVPKASFLLACALLILFSTPSYATVLPTVWDGKCIPLTTKYEHHSGLVHSTIIWIMTLNGVKELDYTKGYIPPTMTSSWVDIPDSCFPKVTAGGPR